MLEVVAGIKNRLQAASVTGADRTYYGQAESGATKPYIIIDFIGGGDENYVDGDMRDEVWQVQVVTGSEDRATAANQARTIQAAIRSALHTQETSITVTGWRVDWFRHQSPFFFSEDVAGEPVYMAGGRYRVRLFESS